MTEQQETLIIESLETLSEQTEVEAKEIVNLLTGFCWDEEYGFHIKERLSMRV